MTVLRDEVVAGLRPLTDYRALVLMLNSTG
jgi:hypothetical protein